MGANEYATTGMMNCCGSPQPPVGSQCRPMLKTIISQTAMTKFGTAKPRVASVVTV